MDAIVERHIVLRATKDMEFGWDMWVHVEEGKKIKKRRKNENKQTR